MVEVIIMQLTWTGLIAPDDLSRKTQYLVWSLKLKAAFEVSPSTNRKQSSQIKS